MSPTDWLYLILFTVLLLIIVMVADVFRRLLRWSPEATRKMVHMIVGVLVAITPFVLHSKWPMVIIGGLFTVVDFFAIQRGFFKGMHGTRRKTYGTVFYPISFVILTLALWNHHKLILVTAMLIMAISDAVAAIVGENVRSPIELHFGPEKKSVQGSVAMFMTTFFIVFLTCQGADYLGYYDLSIERIIWIATVMGIVATASEVISIRGSDNLTVPLGSAFVMFYLLSESTQDGLIFTTGMLLALFVGIVSFRLHF